MKKIALLIVMVFAFSLTQAGNHEVVKSGEHNNAMLQLPTAIRGMNVQAAPVFEAELQTQQATKTKHPKADKKPKVKKAKKAKKAPQAKKVKESKEHKDHQIKKAEHPKKHEGNKVKGEHHHHKKADKK